jgi:hypothetical protein
MVANWQHEIGHACSVSLTTLSIIGKRDLEFQTGHNALEEPRSGRAPKSSEKHNVQRLQLKYRGALYIGLSYMGKSMRESYSALTGKVLGHDSL